VLTGASAVNGTGNTVANQITGNAAAILSAAARRRHAGRRRGADTLVGSTGNDTYVVDSASDVVTEASGEGTETVRSSVSWTLATNFENLALTGTAGVSGTGNSVANAITGNLGANSLSGGGGADTIDGGGGADTLVGGTGDDTYVVDSASDVVTEASGEGTDLVQSSVTWTLGANVENLTLTGASAVNGTGNSLANQITGNGAANVLDGGAGADTLVGGAGDDTYVVDSASDIVTEASALRAPTRCSRR